MTDDVAQSTPSPTESTPSPEVVPPAPVEATPPSPEPVSVPEPATPTVSPEPTPTPAEAVSVVEQAASPESASVIPEESQSAPNPEAESRPVSQPTSTALPVIQRGRKWNAEDRAKSTATRARKIDAHLAKVVAYAKAHDGKITNDEIEKLLRVSDATASRYAKVLVARGVLRQEGKGRGARYALIV